MGKRETTVPGSGAAPARRVALGSAILLPAAVLQIIVVGPGFSTGREVVEYAGQSGPLGLWSILVILVGFAVLCALGYEVARLKGAYNYREFIRVLVGPLWLVFDVVWVAFTVLVTGIVTSGAGEVLSSTFGLPRLPAVLGILVAAGVVLLFGRRLLERFDLVGSVLFSVGVSAFAVFVLVQRWGEVRQVFASNDVSLAGSPSVGAALLSGLVYVGYNVPSFVAVLFCLDRQKRRAETFSSGAASSLLIVVPFTLTYLAILSFYDRALIEAPIPWLVMFERSGGRVLAVVFAVVFVYAVVDTSSALVHAFLERLNSSLGEAGRNPLTLPWRGACTALVLGASFVLSQVGIITLVEKGYTYFAYAFWLVFLVPLLTRGTYLVIRGSQQRNPTRRID